MRLVTWNVNSLTARLPRVLEFLAELRPDVVCLQETKVAADAFPHAALEDAGYRAAAHCAGRWAGVAVLARSDRTLEDATCGLPGEPAPDEARWVEAEVDGVRVCSAYVPNGRAVGSEPFQNKLRFLDAAAGRVATLAATPAVVAGDFNVAPADVDVYDPAAFIGSTHVTPEERTRLAALLEHGFVDAYRQLHPGEVGFTWWDYRAGHFHRKLGMRIDLVLVSPPVAGGLTRCTVERTYRKGPKPSDHAPLLVEFATP